jgi:2-oxo-4-hydroxy-4-carboxy-5-ureidoimidazoline decarboxylase
MSRHLLADVNALPAAAFVALVGPVFEDSPWIAEAAWPRRPFASVDALHGALVAVVDAAGVDAQLGLIRAHPDLAGKAAVAGTLTEESTREQAAAGLDRLTPEQYTRLTELNDAYRARFGFPFVVCAREHTADSIIASAAARVAAGDEEERRTALAEIAKIARLRLDDLITDEDEDGTT